jgi:hypothetical protein
MAKNIVCPCSGFSPELGSRFVHYFESKLCKVSKFEDKDGFIPTCFERFWTHFIGAAHEANIRSGGKTVHVVFKQLSRSLYR